MLCQRINTTKLYAIKSIHKNRLVTSEQLQRVFLEKDVLCKLNHPFIVKLAFCFDTAVKVYFGMEYVPGGELSDRLEERELSIGDARLYVAQVALALCHIHEKMVIYRDLKPQNILLSELGYVKLIDFGLAHVCEHPDEKLRNFCGTPEYLAPEMVQQKLYGTAIDWWALGILTFELIAGASPFHRSSDARTYRAILHDEPRYRTMNPIAVDFVSRLLKKNPYERMVGSQVLEHPFLHGVGFDALLKRTIKMPFVPKIVHGIGPHVERGESAADSRAEATTLDPATFSGFSFTNETILDDAEYVALDVALHPPSKRPDT
jgi:serine/threonine protein kinase